MGLLLHNLLENQVLSLQCELSILEELQVRQRRTCYHIRKAGKLKFVGLRLVTLANGQQVTLNKTGSIQLLDPDGRIVDDYPVPAGALLHFKDEEEVEESTLLAQWDPYNIPILSEKKGMYRF